MHRIRSWARRQAHASNDNPFAANPDAPALPLAIRKPSRTTTDGGIPLRSTTRNGNKHTSRPHQPETSTSSTVADSTSSAPPPPAPPPGGTDGADETSSSIESEKKRNIFIRFFSTAKMIIFHSWINVLLVFVPIGIATELAGVNPTVVFSVNAIAIIPLAALLSFATESVARRMGDTVGALMNVTFGNAVELILFIALVKNKIRIVQASLLGSILSNILLILGMCFLLGGLRYREQIYNSTVTQMSACLLSLSVMSLLMPTAFHASFTDSIAADDAVLQVSRGTSIILLLVYILYLLFQLKSHAYMYESTPQHIIDEESHPGVLHDMLNSSSSDSSSSSSSSDTDNSSGSNTTAKRIKRVIRRGRRRRKSSGSSNDNPTINTASRTASTDSTPNAAEILNSKIVESPGEMVGRGNGLEFIASGDEADNDGEIMMRKKQHHHHGVKARDFDTSKPDKRKEQSQKKHRKKKGSKKDQEVDAEMSEKHPIAGSSNQVSFEPLPDNTNEKDMQGADEAANKRSFNMRTATLRQNLPRMFTSSNSPSAGPSSMTVPAPSVLSAPHLGLKRSSSMPDRLDQVAHSATRPPARQIPSTNPLPHIMPVNVSDLSLNIAEGKEDKNISKTTAVVLLLVSTGLVAVCAEFLVGSIQYMVDNTGVSEAFIGLIILPVVSNAAEHVTAVTVAAKNKMDLAIGVAVGSSIQIALFVTPVVVLLGWILNKQMSLFFSLFETVSLFVAAFIVNFLVLDGRSNYLEGALLCAAYVIIAVAAFFYPDPEGQSLVGGAPANVTMLFLGKT